MADASCAPPMQVAANGATPVPLLVDPSVRSVAIMRLRVGLGDLLCTMPALRALRLARPDLHVAMVTWGEMAPVVDRMAGEIDELVPFSGYPGIPDRPVDHRALRELLGRMAERRFDAALQMYFDSEAAARVTAAVGARRVGGFAPCGASGSDPATHIPYPHHLPEVWRHLRLVEHLGIPLPPGADRLHFPLRPSDDEELARATRGEDLTGPYVVVHPGATAPSRRWPVDGFAEVARMLAGRGLRIVVTGTTGERALTGALRRRVACAVDLTGRTSLGAFAALLRDAALLVSNDTGAVHLAAAVGAPAVAVFLAGDPARWHHPRLAHRVARVDVGCNPCDHLVCPIDHRCATAVTPGRVVALATPLLDPSLRARP